MMSAESVRARWARLKEQQGLPTFKGAEFLAHVKTSRVDTGGDLEITLHISGAQKYNALPATDAPGMELLFVVMPKPRRSKETP